MGRGSGALPARSASNERTAEFGQIPEVSTTMPKPQRARGVGVGDRCIPWQGLQSAAKAIISMADLNLTDGSDPGWRDCQADRRTVLKTVLIAGPTDR